MNDNHDWRMMVSPQWENVAEAVDELDNLVAAMQMPVRDALRAAFIAETGYNPWEI